MRTRAHTHIYDIIKEYPKWIVTSFGLFIEMQQAMSPIRLIHLPLSVSSPSLAKIYKQKELILSLFP